MKKKILVVIALMLVVAMSLSSCGLAEWLKNIFAQGFGVEVELTDAPLNADMLINFADGANPDVLFESDGWSNGDVFNVVWKSHNVHYEDGIMRLGITEEKATAWLNDAEVEFNYTAGEARSQNYYHYGDYEVSMKPSANPGTASTFFVCTGPYDLKDGVPNAHDEIDIEFLGDDTTHIQFNFFVNGVGGNEFMYDLGFDASEEFHTYGFRWEENAITWFVDGEPVYKVTTEDVLSDNELVKNLREVEVLPSTAGRILTNYWCGNERAWGWMGRYEGEKNDNGTTYQWIKTSAEGAPLNPPVDVPPVEGGDEIDWTVIDPIAPTFATTPEYTVEIDGNKANVTYTDVSGSAYKPIEMDVTELVDGKNFVHLLVTNNGTETVNVRVNMYDPTLTGNNTATNISATMNGESVYTDMSWGGSFFDIPAGESAELVVQFGVGGVKLQLMIDSSRNDGVLRSGDVTVEDIKFTAVGEVEAPHKCEDADEDGKCDGCGEDMPTITPPPAHPESGNLTTTVGGAVVQLGGNTSDGYGIHGDEANGAIRVEYTNISTNTYKNVWAQISEVAAGKNEISLKIKNNGEATAYITVKIEAAGAVALMEGKMEIPAGEEHEFKGTFEGVADKLYFFIDSGWSMETTTHAGEVVISEIAFAGEVAPEPVAPIVNISDLEAGTTEGGELIEGTGISASAGLAIDANNKSIDGFDFTKRLKLGGTMKVEDGVVKAGVEVVTTGAAKIVLYAISSSSSDSTRTLQLATLADGALTKLAETAGVDGAAIAKYELTVDAAGTYYIGSTKSGINIYYIAVESASTPEPKPEEPKVEYTDLYVEWKTENAYTITTTDTYVNSARITYTDMAQNSWANINMWVEDKSADCSVFSMKLTNHGAATVSVWVQMKDVAGAELINQNVDIAAGAEEVVTFEYTGTAQMIFFFVDSTHEADAELNTGDITISEVKLGKVATTEEEPPVQEELSLEWWTSSDDYSVSGNTVKYNGAGNSYSCAGAPISHLASGKTTFTVTITNNGTAASRVRVDIQGTAQVGNHTVINTGATGGDVWTDAEWGGSHVTVEAGQSVTLVITYDEATERGAVTNLVVMVDSGRGVADTFNSEVTFSGMSFQ